MGSPTITFPAIMLEFPRGLAAGRASVGGDVTLASPAVDTLSFMGQR